MTIRGRAGQSIAALPPAVRWRVRNAVAVARWLRMSVAFSTEPVDAYSDAFWNDYQEGDWTGLAAIVLRYCAPRSLVDVGCGDGRLLAGVHALDAGLEILGVDGSQAAVSRARSRGLPAVRQDLFSWRSRHRTPLESRIALFDVAVSLETAEHLPPWSSGQFIRMLTNGRLAVFSAAAPGQGGTLHMNERSFDYWRRQFAQRGFEPSRSDAEFRAEVRALDLPWWYAANIHLFERRVP